MLSILIIDDTQDKLIAMRKFILDNFKEIKDSDINAAECTFDAVNMLTKEQYDLVLLDLNISKKKGGMPSPQNAINFLETIAEFEGINYPAHILGVTQLEKIEEKDKEMFESSLWNLMRYGEDYNGWEVKLKNKIQYLLNSKRQLLHNPKYDYDVAIINALQDPEQKWLKRVFGNEGWTLVDAHSDKCTTYYEKPIEIRGGKVIRVVIACQHQMASTASASLTMKVIYNFRPRYLFMTGIAAAIEPDEVNLGDILVASEVWDGASGKYKDIKLDQAGEEGEGVVSCFLPDPRHHTLDAEMIAIVNRLKANEELLENITKGYRTFDDTKRQPVSIHIGPMASVPAVVASKEQLEKLQKVSRKLLGIEMETYGMFYASENSISPRPKYTASFKSASDYATVKKADDYQAYASYTSAALLKYIIQNELEY